MSIVYNKIPQVSKLIDDKVRQIIIDEPINQQRNIRQAMQNSPASGRVYKRGNVEHRASAPGESPAIDTGNLVGSIETGNEGPYKGYVASNAPQSLALELGNPSHNLLPRPAWVPATKKATARIQARLRRLKKKIENV